MSEIPDTANKPRIKTIDKLYMIINVAGIKLLFKPRKHRQVFYTEFNAVFFARFKKFAEVLIIFFKRAFFVNLVVYYNASRMKSAYISPPEYEFPLCNALTPFPYQRL